MRRTSELAEREAAMTTLVKLTSIFEGLASMRIAQIKDQVVQSTKFYNQLWSIYSQIRVGETFKFGRESTLKDHINKNLKIVITGEGSLSGNIDEKLVKLLLSDYDKSKDDVMVIGHHGAIQLAQAGVAFKRYFKMPTKDRDFNVSPVVNEVRKYISTKLYYQEYLSITKQEVKSIELSKAVNERGEDVTTPEELINEATYIFEPSTYAVVAHLERSMMQIAISQFISESKLAQYASRFQAMTVANKLSVETKNDTHLEYNRAKRAIKDERLKEMVNGLKKSKMSLVV